MPISGILFISRLYLAFKIINLNTLCTVFSKESTNENSKRYLLDLPVENLLFLFILIMKGHSLQNMKTSLSSKYTILLLETYV